MVSKIQRVGIVQGDSLNPTYVFSIPAFPDLTSNDWIGRFTIRKGSISGPILLENSLAKSDDLSKFVFTISPTETASIPVGNHFLSVELKNLAIGPAVRLEIVQCPIVIGQSGTV